MRQLLDQNFFNENLLEFGEWFWVFSREKMMLNEYGEQINSYQKYRVWGSLQPQQQQRDKIDELGEGISESYKFYCKSMYRIQVDDIIVSDKNVFLKVTSITPYDQHGVRIVDCKSMSLSNNKDFTEFKTYYNKLNETKSLDNSDNLINGLKKELMSLEQRVSELELKINITNNSTDSNSTESNGN